MVRKSKVDIEACTSAADSKARSRTLSSCENVWPYTGRCQNSGPFASPNSKSHHISEDKKRPQLFDICEDLQGASDLVLTTHTHLFLCARAEILIAVGGPWERRVVYHFCDHDSSLMARARAAAILNHRGAPL